jgi:hypothetical protein
MNQSKRLQLSLSYPIAFSACLLGIAVLTGCAPAIETISLPINSPARTMASASQDSPKSDKLPLASPSNTSPTVQQIHFEQITDNPPYVYRVIEATPGTESIFITTIQSCGSAKPHTPLSSLRLLFSGLSTVRVTTGSEKNIASKRVIINEGLATLDKQPIFLRVLSVPPSAQKGESTEKSTSEQGSQSNCLTDHVVWSSSDDDLTNRSVAAYNHLFSTTPSSSPHPLLTLGK